MTEEEFFAHVYSVKLKQLLVCAFNYFFLGSQFGTVIALLLSGVIAEGIGWEWIFYFFGISGCIWCIVWLIICYDSPAKHPRITEVSLTQFGWLSHLVIFDNLIFFYTKRE